METVSLYRKYRPHNFDNLVGQDHIKNTLINAFKNANISHAYLFTGPRGTGKTSTARIIAKALSCTDLKDGYEPCNECEFCNDINEGRLIDLIEIDAASNRGIDEVRDLKEKISFAPSRGKYKIYIIDEVHMMTKEAFNALLKTLEEPPSHTYFILATTEIHKIPETIISRCQRFDFRRITKKALMTRLSFIAQTEGIEADDTALELISRYVDGGLRDAIGLLEQLTVDKQLKLEHVQDILGISSYSLLETFFDALISNDTKAALKIIGELHSQGTDLKKFLHEFVDLLREKMLEHVAKEDHPQAAKLINTIEILQEAQNSGESRLPQLPLEIAVIKITENFYTSVQEEDVPQKPKEEVKKVEQKEVSVEKTKTVKKETDLSAAMPPQLTLAYIQENWPRIAERVKTPSLRMSLRNATPSSVDDFNVSLEFGTKFHRDKVMEHENRVELEALIQEMFNKSVKIHTTLKELEIAPVIETEKDDKILDEALEILGGELMEDEN